MNGNVDCVVVIGASGFLGRNIIARLQAEPLRIFAVNSSGRVVPGAQATVALDQLASLPQLPPATVLINVAAHRYDASRARSEQAMAFEVNTHIVNTIYAFAIEREVKEIRYASSVAVYPADWDILDDERDDALLGEPHAGEFLYASSKRWGEIAANHHHRAAGISTLSFRLTNPYGPFDTTDAKAAHVATAFAIRALAQGDVFAIFGNPNAERDFVFAGDVAETFVRSLTLHGRHEFCNLAYGETRRIIDLAQVAVRVAGVPKKIEVENTGVGSQVAIRRATAAKLRRMLDLPDFRGLDEGLAATMNWYRDAPDN
jgi:nucleoside-diphosphate-sugar epimerase